jgi:ABC-type transporter MlaC component
MSGAVMSAFPSSMTAAQRSEFRTAFEELLLLSSVKKMGRYRADRFEYGVQSINGNTALVKTVAIYSKKDGRVDRVHLDYSLSSSSGRWMIVNYAMDDVDTVRNYQRQFRILVQRKGVAGTIQHIKNHVAAYRDED